MKKFILSLAALLCAGALFAQEVVYEMDFSKGKPDSVKYVEGGSVKNGEFKSQYVDNKWEWACRFDMAKPVDLSEATKIEITFKVAKGFAFNGAEWNQRFMVYAVSKRDASYQPKAYSHTCIYDKDTGKPDHEAGTELYSTEYVTVTKDIRFEANNGLPMADLNNVIDIGINSNSGRGTFFIKNIKFIK